MLVMDFDRLEPYADMTMEDLLDLQRNISDTINELHVRAVRTKAAIIALSMDSRCDKNGGGCCGS